VGGRSRLSHRLFGLDWSQYLPVELGEGVRVETAEVDDALAFLTRNYRSIFEVGDDDTRFRSDPLDARKRAFYRETGDAFLFRRGTETVGVLIANPSDWSTYYMRVAAFLPAYQGRGLLGAIVEHTFAPLADCGVERVEVEAAPSNFASIRLLTKLGFNVTATAHTDRWGAVLRFTKYLDADAEDVFLSQFCAGVRYQKRSPTQR
jgi:ribosomal protein S18 acetylase RimI-like enzyme